MNAPVSLLFEESPNSLIALTLEGVVVDLNPTARRALAVKRDVIVGRPILSRVLAPDHERSRKNFQRVLQGQSCEWTMRFKRGDSAVRVQRVKAVLLRSGEEPTGVVLFLRDITQTREGRPETVQLQTLLENLPSQFVAVVDTRERIRYSSGIARLHYHDDAKMIGKSLDTLLDPTKENEARLEAIGEALSTGDHWTGTLAHLRADGVVFPVQTFISPYFDPSTGRQLGALIVGRDVTEEARWRERAAQSAHLAGIGRLVGEVAQGTTPTGSVGGGDPLADALLALSRIGTPERQTTTMIDIVNDAVLAVRTRRPELLADVRNKADDDTVFADQDQMARVVQVAIESFAPSGADADHDTGARPGAIRVEVTREGPNVITRVSALRATQLPRGGDVFAPDLSLDPADGLALPIAKSIVSAHEGRMWTESTEAGEFVIAFHLPAHDRSGTFDPTPLRFGDFRSVLVVDDQESVRVLLRRFLEKLGFEVHEAWSGRSAIAQITTGRPPELILTDLIMQDGSGSWFISQLAEDFPDLLRRTVLVTGSPDRPEVATLVQSSGCPVLGKPIDFPELLEALDEIAGRERVRAY